MGKKTPNIYRLMGLSLHRFIKVRPCLTNLISFYGKVTYSADMEKAVDVVCLDFSRAFDSVSYSIHLEKSAACGSGG